MRRVLCVAVALAGIVLLPNVVHAQATIAGVIRDASAAVLPGVTVEASSPVLIEKSRTVISDGTGQYRITDLLPGTYTVTFTLDRLQHREARGHRRVRVRRDHRSTPTCASARSRKHSP